MDEMLEQFVVEGRELVAEAHHSLVALGERIDDRAALDRLFRAIHTLKGSVALFDMAPAERLLHGVETYLDTVRKATALLDVAAVNALTMVVDQTDRWIEAMERHGALEGDAATAARIMTLIADLAHMSERDVASPSPEISGGDMNWLTALLARPQCVGLAPDRAKTAFRYTPDPDSLFRGEDPLALAGTVPDLLALAIVPAAEEWPSLADFEPFRCVAAIEGLSGAEEEMVRTALRLVPDQIRIARLSAAPTSTAPETTVTREAATMLRIDAAKLDRLADQSGELGIAARALGPLANRVRALDPLLAADLRLAQDEIERVAVNLQRSIGQVRLVSLEPVLRRLPRLARETAAALGKPIRFHLTGETTQVDKQIADQLFEPLLHLVRNAIDHGIEPLRDRQAAGKTADGEINLTVRQDGETIAISLTDDGCGIDPSAIRAASVAKGLIGRDAVDALSDAEALRLVFLPGFSTADRVTDVSGRGVGMDAVKTSVERLSGTIAIDSIVGRGTRIALRLPANAINTALLVVSAGREQLGLRLDQVVETTRIAAEEIQLVGSGQACVLRDMTVPVVDLARLLGLGTTKGEQARLIVTEAGGTRNAIRVDGIGERFTAMVRAPVGLLATMPHIAGTALRADGSVLLVLDLAELAA